MKAWVCTNRQHGRYSDQSECGAGWCLRMMKRVLMLCCRTTLAQCLRAEYVEKLISFQHHMINLRKQHNYLLGQSSNFYFIYLFLPWIIHDEDQMPIYCISICCLMCKSRNFLKSHSKLSSYIRVNRYSSHQLY